MVSISGKRPTRRPRSKWVPQILLHDQSASIPIQTDLGVVSDLYSILTDATTSMPVSATLGRVIGQFLADMHCCTPVIQSDIEEFSNVDAEQIMEATTAHNNFCAGRWVS